MNEIRSELPVGGGDGRDEDQLGESPALDVLLLRDGHERGVGFDLLLRSLLQGWAVGWHVLLLVEAAKEFPETELSVCGGLRYVRFVRWVSNRSIYQVLLPVFLLFVGDAQVDSAANVVWARRGLLGEHV